MGISTGKGTGSDSKAYIDMIARVEDIKGSPKHGQKRLVVKEKGMTRSHAVIDIDIKQAKDIEEKETYRFKVTEKPAAHGQPKRKTMGFKAYNCDQPPSEDTGSWEDNFTRFGGNSRLREGKRTKFTAN